MSSVEIFMDETVTSQTSIAKKPGKNIVICCDGTGNDFSAPNPTANPADGRNSNVVKLYTALKIDNEQVGYYHPGVGTMGAPTATHAWSREWSKIKGLAFGAGFGDNVLDAYRYLMEVYDDNGGAGNEDQVYLFGFSRGAYTVRALAGLLNGYGLLCRGNEGHLPYAWRMYTAQHDERDQHHVQPDVAFRETFSHRGFKIHFLGVWDTVSSVGWITSPLRLFNVATNDIVEHARHAVSIDERRCFFVDNLLGDPKPGQDLVQAWFAGVHSDVGGSYLQPDSGLAYITLRWMVEEARKAGVLLDPVRSQLIFGDVPPDPPPPAPPIDRTLLYKKPVRWILHHSLKGLWWLPELIPHVYYNKDYGKEYRRVPLGLRLRQLPGYALVHESVAKRMDDLQLGYRPKNVSRSELARPEGVPPIEAQDGTTYYRFVPINRPKSNFLFVLFDRFVVTTFFALLDVFVLVPLLAWVVMMAALTVAAVTCLAYKFLVWCGRHVPHWLMADLRKAEHWYAWWLGRLWGSFLHHASKLWSWCRSS